MTARRRPPLQLIVGSPAHAVVACATGIARQVSARVSAETALHIDALPALSLPGLSLPGLSLPGLPMPPSPPGLPSPVPLSARSAHVHFTDKLFGASPEDAAAQFERLAGRMPVTVTLHDVPQPSNGTALARRVAAYLRVVSAARGVVCNSEYERQLLTEHTWPRGGAGVHVIPLPVDPAHQPPRPEGSRPVGAGHGLPGIPRRRGEVALLGYFYPGKGHAEVVDAVSRLRIGLTVTAIGGAAPGHEHDLNAALENAGRAGVDFRATGHLGDDDLLQRCREATVPVAAHQHFSASASINTWLAVGRRPLVPDTAYTREMQRLRPGTLTLYERPQLSHAIENAVLDPASTWLEPGTALGPDSGAVADAYLQWWGGAR
ncbi:hypothetical protein [Subtercola sp. YIM 133946]|uniref:hypothetical protein n=1 Tax=Subtercola sp. YIM 133946 TaxID=3118909 RepID=UPI002F9215FF